MSGHDKDRAAIRERVWVTTRGVRDLQRAQAQKLAKLTEQYVEKVQVGMQPSPRKPQ